MANQHAHRLLDELGPAQLDAVVHLLQTMVSAGKHENSDTLSEAEAQGIAEADEVLTRHRPLQKEFGLPGR